MIKGPYEVILSPNPPPNASSSVNYEEIWELQKMY